jgi:hypothetical protein
MSPTNVSPKEKSRIFCPLDDDPGTTHRSGLTPSLDNVSLGRRVLPYQGVSILGRIEVIIVTSEFGLCNPN